MCIAKTELNKPMNAEFPNYKSVQINDKECFQKYIEEYQPLSCEYSFANIYCWAEPYDNSWSIYNDRLMVYLILFSLYTFNSFLKSSHRF